MPGIGMASPSISLSTPAMILSRVDLPEPLRPSTPILAPGKKLSEMSFKICRLGGTVLETRFMEKTYWAMVSSSTGRRPAKPVHLHLVKKQSNEGEEAAIARIRGATVDRQPHHYPARKDPAV